MENGELECNKRLYLSFSFKFSGLKIWYLGIFEVAWLWIRAYQSEIKNGWYDMVDKNEQSYAIGMKFGTRRLLESLITTPSSSLRKSAWRIQYGWLKCKKLLDWAEIWCSGFFGIADYKFELNNQKFEMSDANWRTKMWKAKSYATKGVWVADYESDLRFFSIQYGWSKMLAENLRNYPIVLKICI